MKHLTHAFLALTLIWSVPLVAAGAIADHTPTGEAEKAPTQPGVVRAASAPPSATTVTVNVDHRFTKNMAKQAGLDRNNPLLSSDGVRSVTEPSGNQPIASSECLLAETLIKEANQMDDAAIKTFCERAASATAAGTESVKSNLEEHAGTVIDDAIIHIVRWRNNSPSGTWYHYDRHASGWSGTLIPFSKGNAVRQIDHLLGHGNVAFLAIHLDIDDSCKISYGIEAKHTNPLNQQDLSDLIKLAEQVLTKGSEPKKQSATAEALDQEEMKGIGVWGGQTLLQLPKLPASITLTPKLGGSIRAGSKDAATWDVQQTCDSATQGVEKRNGKSGTAGVSQGKLEFASWMSAANNSTGQDGGSNSDGSSKSSDALAGSGTTVSNEGLHWWDASVAMPVTSYKNLKFDSQNNLIVTKNSNDIKPYALLDFFPGGADLQAANALSMLSLSAGVPMANQPLQKSFVGGGVTLAIRSFRFRPLVGVRIQKERRTTTLVPNGSGTPAQLTADFHSEWHAKMQLMIGFSVADARKVLGFK